MPKPTSTRRPCNCSASCPCADALSRATPCSASATCARKSALAADAKARAHAADFFPRSRVGLAQEEFAGAARRRPSKPEPQTDDRPLQGDRADAQVVVAAEELHVTVVDAHRAAGVDDEGVAEVAEVEHGRDDPGPGREPVGAVGEVEAPV